MCEDAAEAPHVDGRRVLLMDDSLRRHVRWRAVQEAVAGARPVRVASELPRVAKVSDLGDPLCRE